MDKLDRTRDRYPYCITWTPLPFITWILPFIGHTGICSSSGVIYDFAGPYTINEDHMAFGRPTRYCQLDHTGISASDWDEAVAEGNRVYCKRMHNICCDNCHSHVAKCLNILNYKGSESWTMFSIGLMVFFKGNFVSFGGFLKTWLPFLILATVVTIVSLHAGSKQV